jgi:proline dehydrogenase
MSALGMDFDEIYCEENILQITSLADHLGIIVQFDVEAPETHQFYYNMVHKHNLNGAIQAKSPPILLPAKPPRIVKGAYRTRRHKSKTYQREQIIDWVKKYMYWSEETVIVGTHDENIINWLASKCRTSCIERDRIELQYLRGVKEKEFRKYKEMGFKVREYIPYGDNWYPYIMRRIKEDPCGKFRMMLSV